ncbi:hypothetical protein AAMO2058_000565000 [Amorphochlora amoebiformis]
MTPIPSRTSVSWLLSVFMLSALISVSVVLNAGSSSSALEQPIRVNGRAPCVSTQTMSRGRAVRRYSHKNPEELLEDLVHDESDQANKQHAVFDAVGDAIKTLDECLGGNATACDMLGPDPLEELEDDDDTPLEFSSEA